MKESKETQDDENKESMETQEKEKSEGTEQHDEHIISEEFQHRISECVDEYKDSCPCLEYARNRFQDAIDECRRKEQEKKRSKNPKEFSTAEMPSTY